MSEFSRAAFTILHDEIKARNGVISARNIAWTLSRIYLGRHGIWVSSTDLCGQLGINPEQVFKANAEDFL